MKESIIQTKREQDTWTEVIDPSTKGTSFYSQKFLNGRRRQKSVASYRYREGKLVRVK